jgi:hypothetical protein
VNVDTFVIADFVDVTNEGKATVVGTFNIISAASFPARHPMLSMLITVHGHSSEAGKKFTVAVKSFDEKRQEFLPPFEIEAEFPPADKRATALPLRATIAPKFLGLVFPSEGYYTFEVYVDGTYNAAQALYVRQA